MLLQIMCFSKSSNFCSSCLLGIIDMNRSFENRTRVARQFVFASFRVNALITGLESAQLSTVQFSRVEGVIVLCRTESDLKWLYILQHGHA